MGKMEPTTLQGKMHAAHHRRGFVLASLDAAFCLDGPTLYSMDSRVGTRTGQCTRVMGFRSN